MKAQTNRLLLQCIILFCVSITEYHPNLSFWISFEIKSNLPPGSQFPGMDQEGHSARRQRKSPLKMKSILISCRWHLLSLPDCLLPRGALRLPEPWPLASYYSGSVCWLGRAVLCEQDLDLCILWGSYAINPINLFLSRWSMGPCCVPGALLGTAGI